MQVAECFCALLMHEWEESSPIYSTPTVSWEPAALGLFSL